MNTCFAKSFHSSSTRCSKTKTGFSFNRTTPLPLIVSPPLTVTAASMPNDKLKDKIVSLKKELNRVNNEIYEMKLSLNKLENEKETNMKILDVVVADSEINSGQISVFTSSCVIFAVKVFYNGKIKGFIYKNVRLCAAVCCEAHRRWLEPRVLPYVRCCDRFGCNWYFGCRE